MFVECDFIVLKVFFDCLLICHWSFRDSLKQSEVTVPCCCLQVAQSDEPNINVIPVGLFLISANSTDAMFFCPERIAVVLEGNSYWIHHIGWRICCAYCWSVPCIEVFQKTWPICLTSPRKSWWAWKMGSWGPGCKNDILAVELSHCMNKQSWQLFL